MSASREKQVRKNTDFAPKTAREAQQRKEERRTRLIYGAVGLALAVAVVASVVWNSNIISRGAVAATVDGEKYSAAQVSFYYRNAYVSFVNGWSYFLSYFGLDTSKPLADQTLSETAAGFLDVTEEMTWQEYFMREGLKQIANVQNGLKLAKEENFVFPDSVQEDFNEGMETLGKTARGAGSTVGRYLQNMFGSVMTEKVYRTELLRSLQFQAYSEAYEDSLTYTEEELEAAYAENPQDYDQVSYELVTLDGSPAEPEPEEASEGEENADSAAEAETGTEEANAEGETATEETDVEGEAGTEETDVEGEAGTEEASAEEAQGEVNAEETAAVEEEASAEETADTVEIADAEVPQASPEAVTAETAEETGAEEAAEETAAESADTAEAGAEEAAAVEEEAGAEETADTAEANAEDAAAEEETSAEETTDTAEASAEETAAEGEADTEETANPEEATAEVPEETEAPVEGPEMEAARANAEELLRAYQLVTSSGQDLSLQQLSTVYSNASYQSQEDDTYENAGYTSEKLRDWLYDASRQDGDNALIEDGASVYVVVFHSRFRDEQKTVNVRHILIRPAEATIEEGQEGYEEEQARLQEDARTEAERILKEWQDGEATEDSFAALAKEYSQDNADDGGLYTQVKQGDMVASFNDWIFDPARQSGDTDIVETTYGYHIMYFVGDDAPAWQAQVTENLKTKAYSDWSESLHETAAITREDFGMRFVV